MSGISIGQLLIILLIVVVLFGTKKLSSLGSDLGSSLRGFKKAMRDEEEPKKSQDADFAVTTSETTSSATSLPNEQANSTQQPVKNHDKDQV